MSRTIKVECGCTRNDTHWLTPCAACEVETAARRAHARRDHEIAMRARDPDYSLITTHSDATFAAGPL